MRLPDQGEADGEGVRGGRGGWCMAAVHRVRERGDGAAGAGRLPSWDDYDTVGGFVLTTLGHMPEANAGYPTTGG